MPLTVSRTSFGMSMYSDVVISPATTTSPVVISVSQATRLIGSLVSAASRTAAEIWSAILSGCPSVTDSDVNRKLRAAMNSAQCTCLLGGRRANHQRRGQLVNRQACEHGAHALGDRHLDPEPMREVAQHRRRREPLHSVADLRARLLRRRAARNQLAGAAVAPGRMPTRDEEVAHPGQAGERLRL